jgi:hypothetical protein
LILTGLLLANWSLFGSCLPRSKGKFEEVGLFGMLRAARSLFGLKDTFWINLALKP